MLLLVFLMSGLDLKLATTLNQIYDEYTVHFQMNNYFYCIAKKREEKYIHCTFIHCLKKLAYPSFFAPRPSASAYCSEEGYCLPTRDEVKHELVTVPSRASNQPSSA